MISDMLKPENIRILDCVEDWKGAILTSVAPLEKGGFVTDAYGENIINMTLEYGPYYVLTENVALIHGRPEMGAIKSQLAVTVLKQPVKFSEDGYPVRLLVALAATDSESHIDVIQSLADIFMNESAILEIIHADSEDEIYHHFLDAEKIA